MARDNRGDRGAMLVLASLLVVFSLAVIGVSPAVAYYIDTDGDGLADFYEIKHALFGGVAEEGADWDGDGLSDIVEDVNGNGIVDVGETDPYNYDTDGDGISDGIEGLVDSPEDADDLINALDWDSDGDFIPDTVEEQIQAGDTERDGIWAGVGSNETNWLVADTDGEGLIDGWEHMWGSDPHLANTDGDGWTDAQEVFDFGTDPTDDDTDNDGRLDGIGNEDGADDDNDGMINAVDYDSDNDGLDDTDEDADQNGIVDTGETNPRLYDTDADGFSDGYEIYESHDPTGAETDPLDGGIDTDGDGWVDGLEIVIWKTNPLLPDGPDTDQDGLGDEVENPLATPGVDSDGDGLIDALDLDSDNDGIDDAEEIVAGVDGYITDPTDVDTDGDGLPDNAEVMIFGTDPTSASSPSDGDPIDPGDEIYNYQTNFDMADTDEDGVDEGLSAGTDRANTNTDGGYARPFGDSSINALDIDSDGDGLLDGVEFVGATDMADSDSDGDGLLDGEEVHIWGTNPVDSDSDDDGLSDGAEVNTHGTDPLDNDTDGDTVEDGTEVNSWLSNPLDPDTDGDGILDGETIAGTYIDASGATVNWTFTEDDSNVEPGEAIPNVLDTDSDWSENETPANVAYFHDRTEVAYEDYVVAVLHARGDRFHVGPLNPGNIDTDGDGLSDVDEVACESDPLDARITVSYSWTPIHSDTDGLWDLEERVIDGSPTPTMHTVNDVDGDGLFDGDELHPSWFDLDLNGVTWPPTNPKLAHSEQDYGYPAPFHDGLNDGEEVLPGADGFVTNPHYPDTDGDGIWDDDDNTFFGFVGYDPTDFDVDNDGLYDGYEDADHDGVVDVTETDPLDGDTEDDGIYDGDEEIFGTDPLDWDTDGDTIMDGWEVGYTAINIGIDTAAGPFGAGDADPTTKTDPRIVDSDFDGFDDDVEDLNGNGMLDPGETDAQDRDTDGDHLPDFYEVVGNDPAVPPADYYAVGWVDNTLYPTDPTLDDTDGDALEDDLEFEQQTIPIGVVDTDTDGLWDGTEYYGLLGGVTDPSNPDTDNDGCWETEFAVSPIEAVDVDTDADGIFNALDVDSDNDWIWDGAATEDCAGVNDSDADGIPDILDNDSDNDFLSDRQEEGLNTWHTWLNNDDQDVDNDGRMDGVEYFQETHQPHQGEWALGWRPSDPNLTDTDRDGLNDGFEVGVMGPIPPGPWGPGTDPPNPIGGWDFEGLANSEPYLYDSDFDGLSDLDEDLNGDGNNADPGATEPDPMDDDTDNEGLIDGYETITIATDVLLCDTDVDDLADGLETGLLSAMGSDTSPANPCLSQRYDVQEDGAYTTDPLNWDTDNDGLLDGGPGEEDEDRDGFRDGDDPHDTVTDWPAGETDPNEWDTDRGGVNDMLDVDPVLYTLGDWDIDIHPNAVGVMFDTLDIDAAGAGIPPGSNDTEAFQVWHTNLANNPDPGDGPSMAAAPIDTVYFRSTSLHWAGPLWSWPPANYSVPDTGKLDWFHYTAVTFTPPQVEDFVIGTSADIDVTVDVPEGAMPGWYFGYLQAETRRPGTNPGFLDPMPQELPDDYTMLRLYVAPQKDIDICDDDDDPIGVGFASDPLEFPNPPMDGEMHLMGAPMYPGEIEGMFRYANPNTNPDGVWPWPGGTPDGINDYNGLPAYPWVNRTWDTDLPDPQGNVNLTFEIEAQYEWLAIGPVNPTTSISFPSPLMPDLELAQVESSLVFIDTTLLPRGLYVGTVRVFEDVHGILIGDPPDGVWQADETNDTFELQFKLVLPDLDIDDDYASMSGNELVLFVDPTDNEAIIEEIEYWCASAVFPPSNVDAVDGPGDESFLDLQYYDPTSETLTHIPQEPTLPIERLTIELWSDPTPTWTLDVTIHGLMGNDLPQGEARRLRLTVPDLPSSWPAGEYKTYHPVSWIPGNGTIPICARGVATGVGDVTIFQFDGSPNDGSEEGMGQGIVYDESISDVAELMDYFHLTVHVLPAINVEWDDVAWSVAGDPGGVYCDDATVNNIGNVEVTDVHFEASALIEPTTGEFIASMFVGFDPSSLTIPYGGSEDVAICVAVAADKRAGVYEGTASLLADGETLFGDLPMSVTVNHIPGIDVLDNGYNVVGNVMTLEPEWAGAAASGQFEAVNLGNGDLENVQAGITGLPVGVTGNVVILDPVIPWGESRVYAVNVSWIDGTVAAETYPCVVTISADGRTVEDSFQLDVVIGELLACEFDEDSAEGLGLAGETIDVDVTVDNAGNAPISEGIVFTIENLVGETGSFIPSDAVTFDPVTAPIPYEGSTDFTLHVAAPDYLLGQDYEGVLSVYLDGTWMDDIDILVTLEVEDGEVTGYPNPYKASEHDGGITIKVGGVDNAKITVFDMYGGKVTELTSGSGRDTDVVWNLKNDKDKTVASGMYIVTIDIGDEVVTRKIMVIR